VETYHKLADMIIEDPGLAEAMQEVKVGNPITLGPRVTTPEDWAKDQVDTAIAKSGKWLEKSRRPKKIPSKAALEAADKRYDRLEEAKKLKKWEKAMEMVNEDERMEIIEKYGEDAFRRGLEARRAKVLRIVKTLQPLVVGVAQTIDAMPTATDIDREKRLLAARKLMIELGKKRRTLV